MIKRKPTRIELKLDDLDEFEAVKKEVEERRKQRNNELLGLGTQGQGEGAAATTNGDSSPPSAKTKTEKIHERIGYDPTPLPDATARVGTLPSPPPPPGGQPPPR